MVKQQNMEKKQTRFLEFIPVKITHPSTGLHVSLVYTSPIAPFAYVLTRLVAYIANNMNLDQTATVAV